MSLKIALACGSAYLSIISCLDDKEMTVADSLTAPILQTSSPEINTHFYSRNSSTFFTSEMDNDQTTMTTNPEEGMHEKKNQIDTSLECKGENPTFNANY